MWILIQEPKPSGSKLDSEQIVQQAQNKWGLLPGQSYTIGRLTGDITLPVDSTVSKNHAKINVIQTENSQRPEVVLEDVGSRFGTFLNEEILAESQRLASSSGGLSKALKKPRVLHENDRVRFGVAYCIFRLRWVEMEVTSSMLNSKADKSNLTLWLQDSQRGSAVHPNMSEKTSHLVMNNISLSIKVVNCLARGIPIVTPQFFRDLGQCLKTHQKLPLEEDYLPSVSTKESESQLANPCISFSVNFARSKLFQGKLFVFVDKKQFDANSPPCKLAGGNTCLLESKTQVKSITQNDIVISPSAPSSLRSLVIDHISSLGMVPCTQTEIYLAIVHCSLEHYCNPLKSKNSVVNVAGYSNTCRNASDGLKKGLYVPETCSVSGSPAPGTKSASNSRLHVSETLSNPGMASSTDDRTQKQHPVLGETQILDKDLDTGLKRPRLSDSEDDAAPPTKHPNIDNSRNLLLSSEQTCVESSALAKNITDEKENVSSNCSTFKKPSKVHAVSESDDEDEEDMFGFGSLKTKRKAVSPVKSQSQKASKKMRPNNDEDDLDDLFGFDKDNEKKKVDKSQKRAVESTGENESVLPSLNASDEGNDKSIMISQEVKEKFRNNVTVISTGFIGKSDIKREVNEETMEDEDVELSRLSMSVAKVNISNLLRPVTSKPRPQYVPNEVGKSIPNFKKFKRKINVCSRRVLSLVKFDPKEKLNQTAMEDWVSEHQDQNFSQDDNHNNTNHQEEDDGFWNFDEKSHGSKKKKK